MDEINKSEDNGLPSDRQSHKPEDNGLPSDSQSHKPQGNGLPSDRQSHKKVDENWKQNVEKEKTESKGKPEGNGLPSDRQSQKGEFVPPAPDFKFFITTLTLQASIALGHLANPATEKVEQDLTQAKFLIDTIGMLQEKTKNNLTREETELLENLLYELRVAYLAKGKGEAK